MTGNFVIRQEELESDDEEDARLRDKVAELAARDDDDVDLDMGFGMSRFEDWEEADRCIRSKRDHLRRGTAGTSPVSAPS